MAIQGTKTFSNSQDHTQEPEVRAKKLFEQAESSLDMKAYTKANELFLAARDLFKKLPGDFHTQVIACYERLAAIAHAQGEDDKMGALAKEALSLYPQR